MDIYLAISDFTPPESASAQNILGFSKGDKFEIFDCHKQTDWWGARALKDNTIGYVPCKYLQHEERKIGKLLPASKTLSDQQEKALKHFADMQNKNTEPFTPGTPVPDYSTDNESPSAMLFVKRFSNILSSIHSIDEMYPEIPEPDYLNDDDKPSDYFPPPPPPLSLEGVSSISEQKARYTSPPSPGVADELLIQPRKLSNPCVDSKERQALHKELLLNYKIGKNVLQKTELNKVLEKRKESQRIRDWDQQKTTNKRTSLEMKLEERAAKVQQDEVKSMKPIDENMESQNTPEYLKMYRRITVKSKTENK